MGNGLVEADVIIQLPVQPQPERPATMRPDGESADSIAGNLAQTFVELRLRASAHVLLGYAEQ